MKKALCALVLAASAFGFGHSPAATAATSSTTSKNVTLQLTINSPGAGGSQFVLQGLKTPTDPVYSCSKTTAAAGDGTSVHFAVVDTSSINRTTITVSGTQIGTLFVKDAKYVDQSGNSITGGVSIKRIR